MNGFTYRVTLAYDGAHFAGYARQPGETTVEGCLYQGLARLADPLPHLAVAGRTDRGVSASGQVVSFRLRDRYPEVKIFSALDIHPQIALSEVRQVPRSFHAQFSALERHYSYLHPDIPDLDPRQVDRMLAALLGRRCFTAFARDTPKDQNTVRWLKQATCRRVGQDGATWLRFDFAADAFLRRQIRILVATALAEANKKNDDALLQLAERRDRHLTAKAAPAEGLCLVKVVY